MKPNNRFKRVVGDESEVVLQYQATMFIRGYMPKLLRSPWSKRGGKWASKRKVRKSKDSIRTINE